MARVVEHRADALGIAGLVGLDFDARLADLLLQLRGGALGDDLAVVDDSDPVRELVSLLEVLRGQKDGDAVIARQPSKPEPVHGSRCR